MLRLVVERLNLGLLTGMNDKFIVGRAFSKKLLISVRGYGTIRPSFIFSVDNWPRSISCSLVIFH